jgi:hypothetical protein
MANSSARECPHCQAWFGPYTNMWNHTRDNLCPIFKMRKKIQGNIMCDFFDIYPYDCTPLGDISVAELIEAMEHHSGVYTGLIQLLHFNRIRPHNHNIYSMPVT